MGVRGGPKEWLDNFIDSIASREGIFAKAYHPVGALRGRIRGREVNTRICGCVAHIYHTALLHHNKEVWGAGRWQFAVSPRFAHDMYAVPGDDFLIYYQLFSIWRSVLWS